MVLPNKTISCRFFTYNTSGVLTNADSPPTGLLVINGVDSIVTVTVSNITTGEYKAEFTVPIDSVYGDYLQMVITATLSSTTNKSVIWNDSVTMFTFIDTDVKATLDGEEVTLKNIGPDINTELIRANTLAQIQYILDHPENYPVWFVAYLQILMNQLNP